MLDELQLSLCPLLLGGPHSWLPASLALPQPWRWQLREQRLLEGDELLLRYRRVEAELPADPGALARDAGGDPARDAATASDLAKNATATAASPSLPCSVQASVQPLALEEKIPPTVG